MKKRKLTFQLVPSTAWYTNLRSVLPNWSEVSAKVRSSGECAICGCKTRVLHAHEVWKYNDILHIQSLDKIIPVCEDCHDTMHIGHASIEGRAQEALKHYAKVNGISMDIAEKEMVEAFNVWERRSQHKWKLASDVIKTVENQLNISCNLDDPVGGRYYAKVDFAEKDLAKKFDARWDANRRLWYFNSEIDRNNWYVREV